MVHVAFRINMIEDLPKKLDELQALKTLDVSLPPQIFFGVFRYDQKISSVLWVLQWSSTLFHMRLILVAYSKVGLHWASRFNCPSASLEWRQQGKTMQRYALNAMETQARPLPYETNAGSHELASYRCFRRSEWWQWWPFLMTLSCFFSLGSISCTSMMHCVSSSCIGRSGLLSLRLRSMNIPEDAVRHKTQQ